MFYRSSSALCLIFLAAFLPTFSEASIVKEQSIAIEALGKGGLWGLGYDSQLTERIGLGVVGSYYVLDGTQFLSFSPYVTLYPFIAGSNRGLIQLGPQFLRQSISSPVPEWTGTSSNRFGGELSIGYEHNGHLIFRVYGMLSFGQSGIAPWIGTSLGISL